VCFALIGWALLRVDEPTQRVPRPTNVSAVVVSILALHAGVGHVTGVSVLFTVGPWTDMAIPTAAAFALAATGTVASRPCHGVVAVLCGDGVAGTALRRLLPTAVAGPLVLGVIATVSQRRGLVTSDLAVWLMVTLLIVLLAAGTWWLVGEIDRIERDRVALAARHHDSERRFSAMTESAQDAIVIAERDGTITYANQAAHTMQISLSTSDAGGARATSRP
jgi:PAS domain-containing protein